MIRRVELDNVLREEWDDEARTVTFYDTAGTVTLARPWTEREGRELDGVAASRANYQAEKELIRAIALNAAPEELAALQNAHLAGEGIEPGDPWRQPAGAYDAYPLGATVSHSGGTWESTVAANVWEPGVSGWQDAGPGIPDWIQPTGGHDAYALGAVVKHNGLVWQSDADANVWEPGVFGWTEIQP